MNTVNFLNPFSCLKPSPFLILVFLMSLLMGKAREFIVMLILALMLPPAMAITPPSNALSFNSSNSQRVDVPYNAALNPGTLTIEAWVRPEVLPPNGVWVSGVVGNRDGSNLSSLKGFILGFDLTGKWFIYIGYGGNSWQAITSVSNVVLNQWSHIAATYDGTNFKLYVNGVLEGTLATGFVPNPSYPFTIGSYNDGSSYYVTGKIDEVRLWNIALPQTTIQANMHKALAGNETGLEAYYDFDQTSGTILPDLTVHGHNGTLVNSPLWQASGAMPPFPTSASNITPTGFTANWNAVSGATGYRIDVSTDPNFGSFLSNGQDIAAGSGTSFAVTGLNLTVGIPYYFRMRVEKSSWTSPSSASVSFLLPPAILYYLLQISESIVAPVPI